VRPLLGSLFLVFLLGVGFSLLQMISHRPASARFVFGLPNRPSAGREWLLGAALGWGMVVFAVLPIALAGKLHVSLWTDLRVLRLTLISLATIAVASLAEEIIFRGYPFRCLIDAIGPVGATIAMSVLFGLSSAVQHGATRPGIFLAMFSGAVFCMSWLRTHGLWLAWGMRFAWAASMGVLFGLPVRGTLDYATLIQSTAMGHIWLTGGEYGPDGTNFMGFALLLGLIVLVRATRDYAWDYAHDPIIAAGYPMDVPPPAAHAAMEQAQQASSPALVQILPSTPQTRSVETEPKP